MFEKWFAVSGTELIAILCSATLVAGSTILDENLRRANVTRNDLYGKLREANAFKFDQIKAVIFESTGDVSVIHGSEDKILDPETFANVIGAEFLYAASQRTAH